MRQYLLLVASPQQVEQIVAHLDSIHAQPINDRSIAQAYAIHHKALGGIELRLHLLTNLDAVIPHLRQNPVDLLIYDEREGGLDAVAAISQLRDDVEELARLWGPDFHFPISRVIAILGNGGDTAHKTFRLGRERVRDILVAPRSLAQTLLWIARILQTDLEENKYKVGCALSGGGLEGFMFQIGCAYALEQALAGRSLHGCDVFSGISSGSMVATALAADVPLIEIIRAFHGKSDVVPRLKGSDLYDLAAGEIAKRIARQSMSWSGLDPIKWAQKVLRSVPTGFFRGDKLRSFVSETLSSIGVEDHFSALKSELHIGATHQDSFEHVVLGVEPWHDVRISEAVRASCALPPFFTPCRINQQNFIDGQITRSCNLELLVKRGCNLIFIIDPMKPYGGFEDGSVDERGGVYTLIQTVKTLVHTRFRSTLSHLTERYPDVDFLVFQPYEECAHVMSGSPMRYRLRTKIIDLAYRGTLQRLRERHHVYGVKLAKYGFQLASQRQLLHLERTGIDLK